MFAIALIVWALELTGMPRDWLYRSSIYAVAGGTVFATIFSILAVFSQPQRKIKNPMLALWTGRAQELSFFNERFDIKMYFYVVGGTMLSLNALSGAVYHYELFGEDSNPGVFLYAAFFTFYVLDYCIFERVQLYTYDLIHEHLGFKLFWSCLVVYGWLFILPLWGMAVYPNPGFSPPWTYVEEPVVKPRVAPRAARRPADKARRGRILAIFRPRTDAVRGATPFRRGVSPLECSGGFTTGS